MGVNKFKSLQIFMHIVLNTLKNISFLTTKPIYGGQAVIDGVMMKGKNNYTISLIHNNVVQTKTFPFTSITQKKNFLGLPFIRGMILLVEMMILGYKSLAYSTDIAMEYVDEDENSKSKQKEEKTSYMSTIITISSLILSLIFAVFLFKFLPLFTATQINNYYELSGIMFNIVDGIVKLFIFLTYIIIIGQLSDIKEVFKYHGAEHKAINCYEQEKELTIKNVSMSSKKHLRCGTTFMLLVLTISILTYIFIPKTLPFTYNLLLRLALLPLIASISYEFQRLTATKNIFLFKIFLYPGLWVQSLTTKEPSVKHIRCAIESLKTIINTENTNK
jgi:uncharacterized protein YqhQ